jgi:hypothetical protein
MGRKRKRATGWITIATVMLTKEHSRQKETFAVRIKEPVKRASLIVKTAFWIALVT